MSRLLRTASDYVPPHKNVLLLSCMDVRLTDELTALMERDNLTNRYDHVILAGAALGVMQRTHQSWRKTFFQHLAIAVELRQPKDIYIVEHRSCGAYKKFLNMEFGDSETEQSRELAAHRKYAWKLTRQIQKWSAKQPRIDGEPLQFNIRSFLMDLRGDVEVIGYAAAAKD